MTKSSVTFGYHNVLHTTLDIVDGKHFYLPMEHGASWPIFTNQMEKKNKKVANNIINKYCL